MHGLPTPRAHTHRDTKKVPCISVYVAQLSPQQGSQIIGEGKREKKGRKNVQGVDYTRDVTQDRQQDVDAQVGAATTL